MWGNRSHENPSSGPELVDTSSEFPETGSMSDREKSIRNYNEYLRRLKEERQKIASDLNTLKGAPKNPELSADSGKDPLEPKPTPEEIAGTTKRAHKKKNFKGMIAAISIAAVVIAAGAIVPNVIGNKENSDLASRPGSREAAFSTRLEKPEIKSLTGYEVLDKTIDGSFMQYDNIGCYESEGKVSDYAVGNPDAVLEAMGIDPANATAEERGIVQEYFAYSMAEPAASVAIVGDFEGFDGLTQNQAETKIKKMTAEEKVKFQSQLKDYFDKTEYHYETGSGKYRNQGIYEDKEGNKYSRFSNSDLTGIRILIGKTTSDDGVVRIRMSKGDCGNDENQSTVIPPDAPPTVIVIPEGPDDSEPEEESEEPEEESEETEEKEEKEDNKTPRLMPDYNRWSGLEPKNQQELVDNAGSRVDQQNLDNAVTPPTTLEQDQANFSTIEEQKKKDEEAAAEAERIRIEQAERERLAAEQAAAMRVAAEQAAAAGQTGVVIGADGQTSVVINAADATNQANVIAADKAAANANAGVAAIQGEAATGEQQAANVIQGAAAAQDLANDQAPANAAIASANADASVNDRAGIFVNGES